MTHVVRMPRLIDGPSHSYNDTLSSSLSLLGSLNLPLYAGLVGDAGIEIDYVIAWRIVGSQASFDRAVVVVEPNSIANVDEFGGDNFNDAVELFVAFNFITGRERCSWCSRLRVRSVGTQ